MMNSWLKYLSTLPSGLFSKSLTPLKNFAQKLALLPSSDLIIITVGGTNGKGSCVAFLEAILRQAGYRTGAFLSPHLLQYNERIRINGQNVDDSSLIQAFTAINHGLEQNIADDWRPSYFAFSFLSALYLFKCQPLDVLILEVGLGGRFDAVNILDHDLSIITSISLDHTQILGTTREAIGYEKAGIMRKDKPVVIGDLEVPQTIYNQARDSGAILHLKQTYQHQLPSLPALQLPRENAETALIAISVIARGVYAPWQSSDDDESGKQLPNKFGLVVTPENIQNGLAIASLPGRYQCMQFKGKEIIFDVAHNEAAAQLLAQKLLATPCVGRTLAVMSQLKDKDIAATIKPLTNLIDIWYISALDNERAASLAQLIDSFSELQINNYLALADGIVTAFQQALAECQINDRIVVFGSFSTVTIILEMIKNES